MIQATQTRNRRGDIRRLPKGWTKVKCRVGTLDLGNNIALKVLDLAETGVRLVLDKQIANNEEVAVTLEGPHHLRPLRLVGRVVWCIETADHNFCVGIHFRKRLSYTELVKLT